MKATLYFVGGAFLILAIDCAIGHYLAWRKRRGELIRNADINRFNLGAFKGTRDWRHL
jgi:hypothetical protein